MRFGVTTASLALMASAVATGPVMIGAAAAAPGSSVSRSWPVYANARYGYRICYPAALLTPAAEAPNGDGRRFSGANGAVLSVWGSNNALDQTVADAAAEDRRRLGGQVTYSVVKPGWYVLSGRRGSQLYYLKSVFANGAFSTMELRYANAEAKNWASVTTRMSRCFAAG